VLRVRDERSNSTRPQQHYFGQSRSADHFPGPVRCNITEPLFGPDHTDPPAGSFAVICPEIKRDCFHPHKGADIFDRNPGNSGVTFENVCNDPAAHHLMIMEMFASSKLKPPGTGLTRLFLLQKMNWDFQQYILQTTIFTGYLHFKKIQNCSC
jgi:hypothetical protein